MRGRPREHGKHTPFACSPSNVEGQYEIRGDNCMVVNLPITTGTARPDGKTVRKSSGENHCIHVPARKLRPGDQATYTIERPVSRSRNSCDYRDRLDLKSRFTDFCILY